MTAADRVLLQKAYAAYNRRDDEALLALVGDEVDWPDGSGRLRGKDALRSYWARQWAETRTHDEPVAITELGPGRSVVRIRQTVRTLDGALISRGEFNHTHHIRDGLIRRLDIEKLPSATDPNAPRSAAPAGTIEDANAFRRNFKESSMSSNTELVRRNYSSFNARDIDAVLATLAEDVAWANGQDGGHVHGRDAVRTYWTKQWAGIDPRVEPVRITERDDGSVAVEVHQVVRDLEGRLLLDETVHHAFHMRDGRVTRFDIEKAGGLSAIGHLE